MSVLQEKDVIMADVRIPKYSTVNNYGNSIDQLSLKHGSEFIQKAVELRIGMDGSTTRNKHVLACGLKDEKNQFYGLGFIESPGKDAEAMFQGYLNILKRYDFKGLVLIQMFHS